MQMDGTFKLNNKGYPLIIIGTTDRERQLFPSVFTITKSENVNSFTSVARATEDHCAKYFKASYQSCTRLLTVSDNHGSYRNTYTELAQAKDTPFLSDTTTIGMCYFHVKKSVPNKVAGGSEHKEDMDVLAHVPAGYTSLYRNLFKFFIAALFVCGVPGGKKARDHFLFPHTLLNFCVNRFAFGNHLAMKNLNRLR